MDLSSPAGLLGGQKDLCGFHRGSRSNRTSTEQEAANGGFMHPCRDRQLINDDDGFTAALVIHLNISGPLACLQDQDVK